MSKNKILICRIGNLLMSDDGFAHYVVKILEGMANKNPGEIYEFVIERDEVGDDFNPFKFSFGFHDSNLQDMLVFAKKMKFLSEKITIICREPKTIKAEIGLSEEVSKAGEKVVERTFEICGKAHDLNNYTNI